VIAINVKTITRGALSIALICVFFTIFRGPTNIINALLVPLTLYMSVINQKAKDTAVIFSTLFLVCFILFKVQMIFTFFYCILALMLRLFQNKKVPNLIAGIIMTISISLSFWISIIFTDYIFLTHISDIMLRMAHGNYFIYMSVLVFEGALVGISQLLISRKIQLGPGGAL